MTAKSNSIEMNINNVYGLRTLWASIETTPNEVYGVRDLPLIIHNTWQDSILSTAADSNYPPPP